MSDNVIAINRDPAIVQLVTANQRDEIPTTDTWRRLMREARKTSRMGQAELARVVGSSQPAISDIESGKTTHSRLIHGICFVLEIPPPFIPVLDETDSVWIMCGRELRKANPDLYMRMLGVFEAQLGTAFKAMDSILSTAEVRELVDKYHQDVINGTLLDK